MVKKLLILFVLTAIPAVAEAVITIRICEANGETLFDNRNIMVGTKLTIIGSSDSNAPWDCSLLIDWGYYPDAYGSLSARGPIISNPLDWSGSHFPAAGDDAIVIEDWIDPEYGFGCIFCCDLRPEPNDWFIIDYTALDVNNCDVPVYQKPSTEGWGTEIEPTSIISFHHVPTRDFYQPAVPDPNVDPIVNSADYAILADWWQKNCEEPGGCGKADLDDSNDVDIEDLRLFCDYWLEKTEY